jgi:hypothetical protein
MKINAEFQKIFLDIALTLWYNSLACVSWGSACGIKVCAMMREVAARGAPYGLLFVPAGNFRGVCPIHKPGETKSAPGPPPLRLCADGRWTQPSADAAELLRPAREVDPAGAVLRGGVSTPDSPRSGRFFRGTKTHPDALRKIRSCGDPAKNAARQSKEFRGIPNERKA